MLINKEPSVFVGRVKGSFGTSVTSLGSGCHLSAPCLWTAPRTPTCTRSFVLGGLCCWAWGRKVCFSRAICSGWTGWSAGLGGHPCSSCSPGWGRMRERVDFSVPLCLFWPRCGKGKLEDGDGINLNDIEKVLPAWQVGAKGESPTPQPGPDLQPGHSLCTPLAPCSSRV